MIDQALAWSAAALLALAFVAFAFAAGRRRALLERVIADAKFKLESMQRQFERFVPADVVEKLTDGRGDYAPSRRYVTMLFADLRGFTSLADSQDPGVTLRILNGYFARMNEAILHHHGHVNELIGDGLLALFGAHEPNPWQAKDAVLAAIEMRGALARYNDELRAEGLPELRFGIGVHAGEVVAGVVSTGQFSKFSITGDPINVASRVEGLTRDHQVDLLVTDEIKGALEGQFCLRAMPAVAVRGKREPIVTYYVEGNAADFAGAKPPRNN